jgi:hypothetical protein
MYGTCERCGEDKVVHRLTYRPEDEVVIIGPFCAECRLLERARLRDEGMVADIYVIGDP